MSGPSEPLLGVAHSLTGRSWCAPDLAPDRAADISRRHALPQVVGRILAARGVDVDQAPDYLNPTLRRFLPDPSDLLDMDKTADRLARAVMAAETVAILADYDVDGACSGALLVRYLRALGCRPVTHVPDRLTEGYGPNTRAMADLAAQAALVITADCGANAAAALAAAADQGAEVVILDHHVGTGGGGAFAHVNPNRPDQPEGLGGLAACGVVFLALIATSRALRRCGYFAQRAEPDLLSLLDLVALGTICDVMPLTGVNRALVGQGLKVMGRRSRPGIEALCSVAGVSGAISVGQVGYAIGPRINAAGRVGTSDLGLRLLSSDDEAEANSLAASLDLHNDRRRELEAQATRAAIAQVSAEAREAAAIVAVGRDWHPGIVGIVAGRLKDRFSKPAFAIGLVDGVGRGSGRSVAGFDLGALVAEARSLGLVISGGGHPMAAGLTLDEQAVDGFRDFVLARCAAADIAVGRPSLMVEATVGVAGATYDLAQTIASAGPFGPGNPEPRLAIADVRAARVDIVGGEHVRLVGTGAGGGRVRAIAFRAVNTPLGDGLLGHRGENLHLAGTLRAAVWAGKPYAELHIEDAAAAKGIAEVRT